MHIKDSFKLCIVGVGGGVTYLLAKETTEISGVYLALTLRFAIQSVILINFINYRNIFRLVFFSHIF